MSILDPLHGDGYQFWSGIGAGSPLFLVLAAYLRHHNCHVKGCWRLGWRHCGEDWLCRYHHPHDPPTSSEIQQS